MAKRRPTDAISKAAAEPIDLAPTATAPAMQTPATPTKTQRWEDRYQRRTFYIETDTLKDLKKLGKQTGESLSQLINRAARQILTDDHNSK